jgi:hypothetical protein
MKSNPVAKFANKFNRAVVINDKKRETKKRGDYLDDYKSYNDIVNESKKD